MVPVPADEMHGGRHRPHGRHSPELRRGLDELPRFPCPRFFVLPADHSTKFERATPRVFAIAFMGNRPLAARTTRHQRRQ